MQSLIKFFLRSLPERETDRKREREREREKEGERKSVYVWIGWLRFITDTFCYAMHAPFMPLICNNALYAIINNYY